MMAEPYLERLAHIINQLRLPTTGAASLEPKHFFNGAALYANGKICAYLNPMGLALKLPADLRGKVIEDNMGSDYRFFANGPIKREYVALSDSILQDNDTLRAFLLVSINYSTGPAGSESLPP